MPAEPTHAKLKRRSSRKDFDDFRFDVNYARELEQKRSRGEVSCAECRRLKIKCDKRIPCQSCQRRGCVALCPNGSLATGQGTRFVLAATEHLHRRIAKLSGRILQLEDALAALQAKHSSEPHPLLHKDLITGDDDDGLGDMNLVDDPGASGAGGQASDVIDVFGTLSISDHGISRFFGPTGGSESLLLANLNAAPNMAGPSNISPSATSTHSPSSNVSAPLSIRDSYSPHSLHSSSAYPTLVADLALFSQSFPFTPLGPSSDIQSLIESHLPPWDTASTLVHTYIAECSWIFHGVTPGQLVDDMLPAIYRRPHAAEDQGLSPGEDYSGPHDLALLFIVFAIGALSQPDPPSSSSSPPTSASATPDPALSNNALGEHFYQISRAALALQPVLEKPSMVTIQTLHQMNIYNAMSGSDMNSGTGMEITWSLVTLAAHLSQTIGLHRDSARWGLSPKMVQRRRVLFWDVFIADAWQSLNTGRPPSFSLAYIDCSFPSKDDGTGEGAEVEFESAFSIWQCRFTTECVAGVTARTLSPESPSYATIMELDRKVREFPLPEGMGVSEGKQDDEGDMAGSFQRCLANHVRETVLLYIHRSFFAQAIIDQPVNPLKSAYAQSFLAAYRASSTILKSVRDQFAVWPNTCARFWMMWSFAFSAAVVFGTIVTRGPRSPFAQSAMIELEQACILFTKASVYSLRCTKALAILTKLAEKARHALALVQKDPSPFSGASGLPSNIKIKQEETEHDELAIFAGHTRFVSAKKSPAAANVPLSAYPVPAPPSYQPQPQYQPHAIIPPSMLNNWSALEDSYMYVSRPEEPLPAPTPHNAYVPSERTHQLRGYDSGDGNGGGWEDDPPSQSQQQSNPPMLMQPSHIVPSQYPAQYPLPQPLPPHQSQQVYRPQVWPQQQHQEYQPYPAHLSPQNQHQWQNHQQQYPPPPQPAFRTQTQHLPNSELVDLGLTVRDSRLDQRWSSFMQDSGLFEGLDFRPR